MQLAIAALERKVLQKVRDLSAKRVSVVVQQALEKKQLRNATRKQPHLFQDSTTSCKSMNNGHSIASTGLLEKFKC